MKVLTVKQAELLKWLQSGGSVTHHPYMGRLNPTEFFVAWDSEKRHMGRCTATVKALLKHGLLERTETNWRGNTYALTKAGREFAAPQNDEGSK